MTATKKKTGERKPLSWSGWIVVGKDGRPLSWMGPDIISFDVFSSAARAYADMPLATKKSIRRVRVTIEEP